MKAIQNPKAGFFIGVGCPGCGGDIDLEADFFVTRCEHCGSALRIIQPESPPAFMLECKIDDRELRFHVDRYLKTHDLPLTRSTLHTKKLYYPYWKVEGTLLKLRNKSVTRKVYSESDGSVESVVESDKSMVSVTPYHHTVAAGPVFAGLPDSLGLRSESLRVLPFSHENIDSSFEIVPVEVAASEVRESAEHSAASLSRISPADFGENLTRLYYPRLLILYFPYIVVETCTDGYRRFVIDGLVGRVLDMIDPTADPGEVSLGPGNDHSSVAFGKLEVDFHRCATCGEDLPTEPSKVYVCRNCHELTVMSRGISLSGISEVVAVDERPARMVPFWRLKLPSLMSGPYGHLLGGVDRTDTMYVPALASANIEALGRLATRMTAAGGRMGILPTENLDDSYLPVSIDLEEACSLAEIITARELIEHGHKLPERIEVVPEAYDLVYVPFCLENYFYLDGSLGAVALERTLLE